ncbi:MAG TPA: ECF-type sigma factor [Dongiaceae bacterium]|nr:ECF-type sigma factor [Dongiaceae bacterium]
MATPPTGDITERLLAIRAGDREALNLLIPLVYERLHAMAHARLGGRRAGASLDTTALVHEAYLRLVDQSRAEWKDRQHFFAVAATAMRQIVVDRARRRGAGKRGAGVRPELLDDAPAVDARLDEILAIDEALKALGGLSERLVKMVELRFFAGLSIEETAQVMDLDPRTVNRDWRVARALLFRALSGNAAG